MNCIYITITIVLAVVAIGLGIYVIQPVMEEGIPSENWCNYYNETKDSVLNSYHESRRYYCFKNESGWHLNESVPLVLV